MPSLAQKLLQEESDTLALMNLSSKDHVVMIGLFRPLVPRIEQTGAKLTVLEKQKNKALPHVLSFKSRGDILKRCTVAIITATSILNNTLENNIKRIGKSQMGEYSGTFHACLPGYIHGDACYPFGRLCCLGSAKSHANCFRGRGNTFTASLPEICQSTCNISMFEDHENDSTFQ